MANCISGKKRYDSRHMAEDALIDAWERNYYTLTNGPVNVYRCEDCGDWHWTSKGTLNERLAAELRGERLKKKREANDWEKRFKF